MEPRGAQRAGWADAAKRRCRVCVASRLVERVGAAEALLGRQVERAERCGERFCLGVIGELDEERPALSPRSVRPSEALEHLGEERA